MVPHMSGTSIDAQERYAAGTKAILDSYWSGREDYRPEDLIGKLPRNCFSELNILTNSSSQGRIRHQGVRPALQR